MSWKATDLSENEARQQAADLNVVFNQYGQRTQTTGGKSARRCPSRQRPG